MTISDEDLKELKSCIYHDLAEMLRRCIHLHEFKVELQQWALRGGDPDLEEQA